MVGVVVWEACQGWANDRCGSMAAALAFYAAFSIAPMLIIVIAVAGALFGVDTVSGRLFAQIGAVVGADGAKAIQTLVTHVWHGHANRWAPWISGMAIVIGASATFSELDSALNVIWHSGARAHVQSAWVTIVRVRLISFALVIGVGFLMTVLLVVDSGLSLILSYVWTTDATSQALAKVAEQGISLLFLSLAFAVLLKVLPTPRVRWADVAIGACTAAVLFGFGKGAFSFYLSHAGAANLFSAAGALAIILMWLFYSATVFLFGAELAAAFWRHAHAKCDATSRPAVPQAV